MPDPMPGNQAPPCVASLVDLVTRDPFSLSAADRMKLLVHWERHMGWLESLRADALTAVAGPGPRYADETYLVPSEYESAHRVDDAVVDEVAVALRVATTTASRRIEFARDQTSAQTRRSIRRVAASACPREAGEQIAAEFARRDVHLVADGSVMATIVARLPAPDAMVVWNALTACALRDQRDQDSRTMAHRRADALTGWAEAALECPSIPRVQGKKRLETQLVVSLDTLCGLNDQAAELVGFGPIPAALGRQLAAESTSWRRLVTDPVSGHLLDYGTSTYSPPAGLREFVIARDRTCQFPGCHVASWRCDLDHVKPWAGPGGQTSSANLIALCRRHHRRKTHHRWRVEIVDPPSQESDQPPVVRWTSPRGLVTDRVRVSQIEVVGRMSNVERALALRLAA